MPTIKDVAKKAGVSISTASYALNNQPAVHPKTKQRVLDAAKALNYYPHGAAKNLKSKRTGRIGVFIYGFSGPIFSDVIEGVRQELQAHNYNIIVSSGRSSTSILQEREVDGAIVFDSQIPDEILLNYCAQGRPLFVLDRALEGENIYSNIIDNEGLVYGFIREMVRKGYRDFAYLSGPDDAFNNTHRYDGFQAALKDEQIDQHHFYHGDFTIEGGYKVGQLIARQQNKPRFFYCANDESAIGFMQALSEAGLRVPDDIAVAGFDNIPMGRYVSPRLTTVGIDHIGWGRRVTESLMALVRGDQPDPIEPPTGSTFMRESC
ncbi:MAG: LacI family transcriptional regulator [Acholeplasmatales bacterium]|nr:MAG: LacI family transcriptional regulator [Acholeplasmatales bacterium]